MALYTADLDNSYHLHIADSLTLGKVTVQADPIVIRVSNRGVVSGFPTDIRNPDLDTWWHCRGYASTGLLDPGLITITLSISGTRGEVTVVSDPIIITVSQSGTPIEGIVVTDSLITIRLSIKGDAYLVPIQDCWVWTSRIGAMDFTDHQSGEVSKRPMPWNGWVYAIKKLGSNAVVYGQNGITLMLPSETAWGLKTIHPIGLKGKNAVVAIKEPDPIQHVFVDKTGQLGRVSLNGGIQLTDYSVWLSAMGSKTVLSYDPDQELIYICDGTRGFVLSDSGLGQGPATITGTGVKTGTFYATSPTAPTFDPLNICTDILDFSTRTQKTIYGIDVGTAATNALYAAIDYRWHKGDTFVTSPWVKVDRAGRAHVMVSGIEFKIRLKLLAYEAIEVDYITVLGKVADLLPIGAA